VKRVTLCLAAHLGCAAVFGAVAGRASETQPHETTGYAEKIAAIDRSAGYLFQDAFLLGDELFNELATEGAKNTDACIHYLAAGGQSDQQRAIAILSMHRLGLPDYIGFLRHVGDLFDRGLISQDELSLAAIPTNELSTLLMENHEHKEVRDVLEAIAARTNIRHRTRVAIESILSGEAWESLKVFRRECCTPRNQLAPAPP
jgi:hypothetical protein